MNTHCEPTSRNGESEYRSGKRMSVKRSAMFATASQRVHRGTNLPPGKSKKNSATKTVPSISTPRTGNHQAGWEETREFAAVGSTVTVPNVTRNNEVSRATRSSERRQKMSAPTASHTSWKTLSITTFEI